MPDASEIAGTQRDRSPAFPVIPLQTALERLVQFEAYFKRSPARPEKMGDAWKIGTKAYVDRIAAALRYFGLLEYQGTGKERQVVVSEDGRKYLKAQQEETKREVIRVAALRPRVLAKAWSDWGDDRPADPACIDQLVQNDGFSVAGARDFLKVYDATISFAGLGPGDKVPETRDDEGDELVGNEREAVAPPISQRNPPPPSAKGKLMDGERELTSGLLSKETDFRLIVRGHVGVKEIEMLIKKLTLDKEILADESNHPETELGTKVGNG